MFEKRKLKTNKDLFFDGPLIISPKIFQDNRGYFFESWNQNDFNKLIMQEIEFVQLNQSFSNKGVLRGLHYQIKPYAQGKLVKVCNGLIYDVIVDLRKNSQTFCQWGGVNLDHKKNEQLWIPEGFAHGFISLTKNTTVQYKVTNYWNRKSEKSLLWDDPDININWKVPLNEKDNLIISSKDKNANSIKFIIMNDITF